MSARSAKSAGAARPLFVDGQWAVIELARFRRMLESADRDRRLIVELRRKLARLERAK